MSYSKSPLNAIILNPAVRDRNVALPVLFLETPKAPVAERHCSEGVILNLGRGLVVVLAHFDIRVAGSWRTFLPLS